MTEYDEFWERWVGTSARLVEHVKPRARVNNRDGRRWITFPDEINGKNVIVEMPDNAPTSACAHDSHDHSSHRPRRARRGRILLKLSLPGVLWRCGCPCDRDPHRAARLF